MEQASQCNTELQGDCGGSSSILWNAIRVGSGLFGSTVLMAEGRARDACGKELIAHAEVTGISMILCITRDNSVVMTVTSQHDPNCPHDGEDYIESPDMIIRVRGSGQEGGNDPLAIMAIRELKKMVDGGSKFRSAMPYASVWHRTAIALERFPSIDSDVLLE